MDKDGREEIIVILAGLIGVLMGQLIRRSRHYGADRSDSELAVIGTSTLVATPALARIAGDALNIERRDSRSQAAMSLIVGLALTLLADDIGRYFPGNRLTSQRSED